MRMEGARAASTPAKGSLESCGIKIGEAKCGSCMEILAAACGAREHPSGVGLEGGHSLGTHVVQSISREMVGGVATKPAGKKNHGAVGA